MGYDATNPADDFSGLFKIQAGSEPYTMPRPTTARLASDMVEQPAASDGHVCPPRPFPTPAPLGNVSVAPLPPGSLRDTFPCGGEAPDSSSLLPLRLQGDGVQARQIPPGVQSNTRPP